MHDSFLCLRPYLNSPVLKGPLLYDHYFPNKLAEWSLPDLRLGRVWEGICEQLCCKLLDYSDQRILLFDAGRLKLFHTGTGALEVIPGP
jgi:hypothetical protein